MRSLKILKSQNTQKNINNSSKKQKAYKLCIKKILALLFILLSIIIFLNADSTTGATQKIKQDHTVKQDKKTTADKDVTKEVEEFKQPIEEEITKKEIIEEETKGLQDKTKEITEKTSKQDYDTITQASKEIPEEIETQKEKTAEKNIIIEEPEEEKISEEVIAEKTEDVSEEVIAEEPKEESKEIQEEVIAEEPEEDISEEVIEEIIEEIETLEEKEDYDKEKLVLEEEIEEKIEEEDIRTPIEIQEDSTFDFVYIDNTKKKSHMIIFEDNYDSTLPSLLDDFEDISQNEQLPWYKTEDFIPQNFNEFLRASPDYSYGSNNVIKSGKNRINSKLGDQVFLKAYNLYKSNNIKTARLLFEKLIHYNYRASEASYYISWCYDLKRDYISAINYMNKAIKLGKKSNLSESILSDYSYQIGSIYLKLEDYINSIYHFKNAIEKNPLSYKSYNMLGISYYKIGNLQKALEIWKKGMEGNNSNCIKNYKWLEKKIE